MIHGRGCNYVIVDDSNYPTFNEIKKLVRKVSEVALVMYAPPHTMARVDVRISGFRLSEYADSRCRPGEPWDDTIGLNAAAGMAEIKIAKRIQSCGDAQRFKAMVERKFK